ncbi:hypothetical protein GWD52_09610 [Enterobacteriaceae bacterium 4M9]|nr:hypothetical protein [Enterobacteriaceae bacterium 4M9]
MFRLFFSRCSIFILVFLSTASHSRSFSYQIWLSSNNGIYQSAFNSRGEPVIAELMQNKEGKQAFSMLVVSHISRQKCAQIKPQTFMQVNGVDFPVSWRCREIGEDCVEHLTVSEKQYIDLFVELLRNNLPVVLCLDTIFFPSGFSMDGYRFSSEDKAAVG